MTRSTDRRAKRKSKPKTKTSAQLKQECYKAVQKLARIAAADDTGHCACVSCGVVKHYKDMQGGHFIPEGQLILLGVRYREYTSPMCSM